jgi:hypothetical protein
MSRIIDLLSRLNLFTRIRKLEAERDELRENIETVTSLLVALSDYIDNEARETAKLNESIDQIVIAVAPRRVVGMNLDVDADLDVK